MTGEKRTHRSRRDPQRSSELKPALGWIGAAPTNRRTLIKGWAAAMALPGRAAWSATAPSDTAADTERLLVTIGEILLPTTGTTGAGAHDVTAFVLRAVAHGMRGAPPDLLRQLQAELDRGAGGAFLDAATERQIAALETLDAATFAPGAARSAWPLAKTLILMGYYTSETGASRELDYEPVPGRFDPDIPVVPGQKALSNDWTGVAIRKAGPNG